MATLRTVSGVMGSRLAVPRMPSVPKSLRVVADLKASTPPEGDDRPGHRLRRQRWESASRLRLRLEAASRLLPRGRHRANGGPAREAVGGSTGPPVSRTIFSPRMIRRISSTDRSRIRGAPWRCMCSSSRCSVRMSRALRSPSSTMRRISSSITSAVASDTFLRCVDRMAEENLFLVVAVAQRPQLVAEAQLGDHAAGDVGGAADVLGGAGRDLFGAEHQLLGDAAAEARGDLAFEFHLRRCICRAPAGTR